VTWGDGGALGGTRTPNLLIRSQMLYPLSYERTTLQYTADGTVTKGRSGYVRAEPYQATFALATMRRSRWS
jgi:hypothetical protein